MKPDILVILPTRQRPARALQTLSSILATTQGRVDVVLCQDSDDPTTLLVEGKNVRTLILPRMSFSQWINHAARRFCDEYPFIGCSADDFIYQKPLWDYTVRTRLRAGLGIVYGPDGIQNENLPTHPFLSAEIVRALGRVVPTELAHYYNDNYLKELGTKLGCLSYLPGLLIEHRHHSVGLNAFDSLNAVNEKEYEADAQRYYALLPNIEIDADTVRAYMAKAVVNK